MSGPLTRFARRWWSGAFGLPGGVLRVILLPLSWLWRLVTALRNRRWDQRGGDVTEGAVVVSVGNLAVGGTGKTPLSAWVARVLAEVPGVRPALLLSGYGTDEVLLHRAWNSEVPVVADPDRVAGARRAVRDGATAVVVDDGFQHRRLARDLDLVLLSADDHFPGGVLPVGPYREPPGALARADAVVLTRRAASVEAARALAARVDAAPGVGSGKVLGCVRLSAEGLAHLPELEGDAGTGEAPSLPRGALVLTAIARPDAFRRDVASLTDGPVDVIAHADHHEFAASDVRRARQRAGDRPIVVTEKDAVKLEAHHADLGEAWVLREQLVWDWGEDAVRARLTELAVGAAGTEGAGETDGA